MSLQDEFIKSKNLQKALVQARFYNGTEMYVSEREKRIVLELLRKSSRKLNNQDELEKMVYYFLDRRRTKNEKYEGSSLEIIFKKLLSKLDPRKEFSEDEE